MKRNNRKENITPLAAHHDKEEEKPVTIRS